MITLDQLKALKEGDTIQADRFLPNVPLTAVSLKLVTRMKTYMVFEGSVLGAPIGRISVDIDGETLKWKDA